MTFRFPYANQFVEIKIRESSRQSSLSLLCAIVAASDRPFVFAENLSITGEVSAKCHSDEHQLLAVFLTIV